MLFCLEGDLKSPLRLTSFGTSPTCGGRGRGVVLFCLEGDLKSPLRFTSFGTSPTCGGRGRGVVLFCLGTSFGTPHLRWERTRCGVVLSGGRPEEPPPPHFVRHLPHLRWERTRCGVVLSGGRPEEPPPPHFVRHLPHLRWERTRCGVVGSARRAFGEPDVLTPSERTPNGKSAALPRAHVGPFGTSVRIARWLRYTRSGDAGPVLPRGSDIGRRSPRDRTRTRDNQGSLRGAG